MTIRAIIAMTVLLSVSSAAFAQSMTPTAEQKKACGGDVRRFCASLKLQDGAMAYIQCLQTNRIKLSGSCRDLMANNGV
jgi:hypothetical protein